MLMFRQDSNVIGSSLTHLFLEKKEGFYNVQFNDLIMSLSLICFNLNSRRMIKPDCCVFSKLVCLLAFI